MKLKTILGIFFVFCFIVFVQALEKDNPTPYEKNIKTTPNVNKSSDLSQTQTPKATGKKHLRKAPKPGTIVNETIDKETGAIILELSNGARVILKNTARDDNLQSDRVILRGLAKGGTMAVTNKDDIPSARFVSKILGNWLYTHESPTYKDVSFSVSIDAFERCVIGSSSVEYIKALFELIYQKFCRQDFDSANIKNLIVSCKKAFHQESDPSIMINKILYNNPHFYTDDSNNYSHFDFLIPIWDTPLIYFEMSDYSKITPKRMLKFLKKCFNPADFIFVFVGDINIETFKTYIKNYIASIPRSQTLTNQKFTRPKPSKQEIYTDDKDNTGIRMSWVIEEKYSQKLKVTSKVLEAYINLILNVPHYEPRCGVFLNPFYDELCANIRSDLDDSIKPNEHIANVFKHMQDIANGKIDTDIFSKAKTAVRGLYENDINDTDNYAIASSYACSAVWHNVPLGEFEKFPLVCQAISKKDLKDLALRLLKGKYYQIIVYPEKFRGAE
ncbi:hypothetical protein AGMMS49556_06110 [Endomicrobiia bacterium]|nr:hypothetical protein AGMMS49556_06110 [Endomicrobiia bacterium]